jgi:hypothetical protein
MLSLIDLLRLRTLERPNHVKIVTRSANNGKRYYLHEVVGVGGGELRGPFYRHLRHTVQTIEKKLSAQRVSSQAEPSPRAGKCR